MTAFYHTYRQTAKPQNLKKVLSSGLAVVFAQSIEASQLTGDAPTTAQWAKFYCLLKGVLYFGLMVSFWYIKSFRHTPTKNGHQYLSALAI